MLKLHFESAWDQTIAPMDREAIVDHFHKHSAHIKEGVHFSFLWQAINHRGERLVTVLVLNGEATSLRLQNAVITYYEHDQQIATGTFTLPCEIAKKTAMPWTFIFSQGNQTDRAPQFTILNEELTN